jgi:hypothetical protein
VSIDVFIDENRDAIDAAILIVLNGRSDWVRELDDDDRADWIANDEGLYLWAMDEGVSFE